MSEKNVVEKELEKHQQVPEKHIVKRTYFFEIYLAVTIAGFGLLATLAKQNPYFGFDLLITRTIQQIAIPGFDPLMKFITTMGNFEWGIATIIVLLATFVMVRKNINAFFLLVSVVGTETISVFFKGLISRPRPDPGLINQFGSYIYSDSFPSGHVLFYIGCYGFLLYLTFSKLKHGGLRTALLIILSALLVLIGISRIYVGAHWFSDTLGAYLIGSVWLFVVIHLYAKFAPKKNE